MKISQQTRFPYPVLSSYSDDYTSGAFSVEIEISESMKTGALLVRYEPNVTEESLRAVIENGSARPCLFVTCLETYYNRMHEIDLNPGIFEVEKGALGGNVVLLPLIVASTDVQIHSDNLHEDYAGSVFDFDSSAVLAVGDEYVVNVGREKLAPVESIFNLAISDKVPVGEFRVNPDEEKITILAEKETYYTIFNIRNNALGKAVLLNSVYLPALMEVLAVLEQDAAAYRDRSWLRVFEGKCTHFNINMEKPELLEASQKLLRTPFPRVCTLLGEMD